MATTGRVRLGNLPAELTSFVGRVSEFAAVKRRLADARLVTLTGMGGTGKTRLALRVAADLRRAFPGGVWFVDLTLRRGPSEADPRDPDVPADLAMAVLGARQQAGGAPTRQVIEFLADRHALLVLDNCEHLLPACTTLVHELLRACPELRVLATSREPLSVGGETLLVVPPLPVPAPGHADLAGCEATALFLARAGEALPGWAPAGEEADAVAELCRRLDGLPLAIELAAARVRVLSPGQILDRLADRFSLLKQERRGAPARQRTLRACVEWSYDLCGKPERMLWARLSVFAGGFELDAIEGVCADEALPEGEVLDVVASLVDKSILIREDDPDGRGEAARFRMLETVREFGQERLRDTGEEAPLRRRHRDWYERLALRANGEWMSERQGYWAARLPSEHPNFRTAIEYGLAAPGQAEETLRLIMTVPLRYWFDQSLLSEVRGWLEDVLARTGAGTVLRARALILAAQLTITQGDPGAGMPLLEQGEDLARRLDARVELAYAANVRALVPLYRGDLPAAVAAYERMGEVLATVPDAGSALALELRLGRLTALGMALTEDPDRADACFREVLEITEPLGEFRARSYALWGSALAVWRQGRVADAEASLTECLRLIRQSGSTDLYSVARCVEVCAWMEAGRHRYQRAATLLGAVDAFRALSGTPVSVFGHLVDHHRACERDARAGLGDGAFTAALARGQAMSYEEAIRYVLDEPGAPSPAGRPATLTRREDEVAGLIAQGLSNKEIAAALVISQRTAESHVEHILAKLGFSSRSQVAAWSARR